ncbi:MAG: porin family protein [Pseudomonadota bacterium]
MELRFSALVCALLVFAPHTLMAKEWEFEASIYFFAAETKSGVGDTEVTLSFGDALENLDVALMGALQASYGPWSLIADYMLTDLSFGSGTPGDAFSGANASIRTQVASFMAFYDVHEATSATFSLGAGARWFDTDTTVNLLPGTIPETTIASRDHWSDPVVGARAQFALGGDWTATAYLDYGGFSSNRESYQFLATANWEFSDGWMLRVGYRYLNVENDEDGQDYFFRQSGPLAGISHRF